MALWKLHNSNPTMQLSRGGHTCSKPCALGHHALSWSRTQVPACHRSQRNYFRQHRHDREHSRHASHHLSTCRAQQDGSVESSTNLVSTVGLLGLWIALAGEPPKPPVLLLHRLPHAAAGQLMLSCSIRFCAVAKSNTLQVRLGPAAAGSWLLLVSAAPSFPAADAAKAC